MRMSGILLPKSHPVLAAAERKPERQAAHQIEVALFEVEALFAEGQGEERLRIGVEIVVEHELDLAGLEREALAIEIARIIGQPGERLADDRDVGIGRSGQPVARR
jgi:hypothetical protein